MRLIIVSNRLPVSLTVEAGVLGIKESAGGLATGVSTYLEAFHREHPDNEHVWLGWPGTVVPEALQEQARVALAQQTLSPVFLTEEEQDAFYFGFCNDTVWPLFHCFPSLVHYSQESWESYKVINERFAEELVKIARPGDVIWVHDYQLMLVPRLLRAKLDPSIAIGFFLHTPFPTFEIFRLLPRPWRRSILLGLLGADLVGFHTYDYAQYFAGCVERIMGHERTAETISLPSRNVETRAFPIGIDFGKFFDGAATPEVVLEREKLAEAVGERKLILSIDRLDYTKGIEKRLHAYESFFEEHPEYEDKVTLALVVIPSREEVPRYAEMKREIDGLVGRINGRFGTMDWTPILYQYSSLPFAELSALYAHSDVALVTPLRDGMNMIAKEYVASRRDQTGVLVLSEMAGAAHELGEALLINPNHTDEIVEALYEALQMPVEEQVQNNSLMQERLKQYDVVHWGNDFVEELRALKKSSREEHRSAVLTDSDRSHLVKDFVAAKKRLLLFDYDGTLVPFSKHPLQAQPDYDLLTALSVLGKKPDTTLAILSGRSRTVLESWLGETGATLSAEHGAWIQRNGVWSTTEEVSNEWKEAVMPILRTYVDRVPGTFLEEKDYSVVWHYRAANPAMANMRAKELASTLRSVTTGMNALVQTGSKIIEVRSLGVDKGTVASLLLDETPYDFVIALGDDTTDEDMFRVLPESTYTIKINSSRTAARFVMEGTDEVRELLHELARTDLSA